MIQWIAALAPLLVGAVLVWAARVKLVGRGAELNARRLALSPLLGDRYALPAYRVLGAVELIVGILLIAPPALPAEAGAATALSLGFLGYLGYARTVAPDSSCGCMSTRRSPVSTRSLVRAGLLILASALATAASTSWLTALGDHPLAGPTALLVGAAAVVALSPELDGAWLLPLRRLRVRWSHPLANQDFDVPLTSSVDQLQRSHACRMVAGLLRSDVREHWDEGDWRMVCYTARYGNRTDTIAVFAVPRLSYEPAAVRVAIVDDETGETLVSINSEAGPASGDEQSPDPDPALVA
jgi:hypothetical protein